MIKIYRNYYAHWVDFNIWLSLSALSGLGFAIYAYETTFFNDYEKGNDQLTLYNGITTINTVLLGFSLICAICRQNMRGYWTQYKEPVTLFRVLNSNQNEDTLQNELNDKD